VRLRFTAIAFTIFTIVTGIVGSLPSFELGLKLMLLAISVVALPVSIVLWVLVFVEFIARRKRDR
jgi:tetrahydromethanopterin S-methyltransferase subunit C